MKRKLVKITVEDKERFDKFADSRPQYAFMKRLLDRWEGETTQLEQAKSRITEILRDFRDREERYWLDGKFPRWGRIEEDLHKVLEQTPAAERAARIEETK